MWKRTQCHLLSGRVVSSVQVYILSGTYCLVHIVWYILSGTYCLVHIVWYILSGTYCLVQYMKSWGLAKFNALSLCSANICKQVSILTYFLAQTGFLWCLRLVAVKFLVFLSVVAGICSTITISFFEVFLSCLFWTDFISPNAHCTWIKKK